MTEKNPLLALESLGQSIWMDFIRRGTIESGELKGLIEADGLTSNPSIFEKAKSVGTPSTRTKFARLDRIMGAP